MLAPRQIAVARHERSPILSEKSSPLLRQALAIADSYLEPIVDLTTRLTEISAFTGEEFERAEALQQVYTEMGYEDNPKK